MTFTSNLLRMLKIKHLSITAKDPQKAAQILAELTDGIAELFRSKTIYGAWLCTWNKKENELIEFIPNTYLLSPGEYAAYYKLVDVEQNFNSTHILLETVKSVNHLKRVADKYDLYHCFRPRFGGPLYEVWIEQEILIEFISNEIRSLSNQ